MMTVVLATRNRAQILKEVLTSFCNLRPPAAGWKLVVIDNGSTDDTSQVLAAFKDRLPLQSAFQPTLGKNHALNLGLSFLEGDLAVFTDDDVFPRSDWLIQLCKAADAHPEYSMFGGAIIPRWEAPPPSWVKWVEQGPVFTLTDPSFKDGPIIPGYVFGPNMMIRASIFAGGVQFDPTIGPRGSTYPMGSETELLLRLDRSGHKSWHVGDAVVEHLIRIPQLNESWVSQRAIRYGRGYYRMFIAEHMKQEKKLWFGAPRHLLRDLPKEMISIYAAVLFGNREDAFRARWRFNFLRGHLIEALAEEKTRRTAIQSRACRGHVAVVDGVPPAKTSKEVARHS
jgi:glycosyltransferase involved in cell wall biosynthesis